MDKRFPHTVCIESVWHAFEMLHVTLLLLGVSESFEECPLVLKQSPPGLGLLIVPSHDLRLYRFPGDLADGSLLPKVSVLSYFASNVFLCELVPKWLP